MQKRMIQTVVSGMLVASILFSLTGCAKQIQGENLMEGVTPNTVDAEVDFGNQNAKITDFAVRLFQASEKGGENTLISPLSVLYALGMTANGAEGETLSQMESVLGMTAEELNLYLYSYRNSLPQGEKYKYSLANSIWFTDEEQFCVDQKFLQTNADYYGADVYKAAFDAQTCKSINQWVKQKTDGMIPEILDEISPDAVMYLVNALTFEAEWKEIYKENQVRDGRFTKEDGTEQKAEFLYGEENVYLEDDMATGFIRYYAGNKYAFVAMLPKEGVSVSDYIASLDGTSVQGLLNNPQNVTVYSAIPKFETMYDVEMSEILKAMGMPNAFDARRAELEKLGTSAEGNIYISRVLHKTFLSIGERGTKAGAATVVEAVNESAMDATESRKVHLDRPFVYMLVDCENHVPFFIGTMMDIHKS